jgi:catechol 2,3-dioxygenase-like lactoylglutathione lyase family enzyme
MEPCLNVITLAVDDLERALVFYRDGLGLQTKGVVATDLVDEKTGAAGSIVIFKLESGLILTLYPRSELAKDAAVLAGPPQSGEFSLGQLVASRADVDRILEQAAAAGAVVTPPHDRPGPSTPATSATPTDTSGRSSGIQVTDQKQTDAASRSHSRCSSSTSPPGASSRACSTMSASFGNNA